MLPFSAHAGDIDVPSGQDISRHEILVEPHQDVHETWLVLRYLAPQIARDGGSLSYADAAADLDFLCAEVGLKAAQDMGNIDQIVVTLMDQPLARGEANPDVTQFNSAYRVVEGACIWE